MEDLVASKLLRPVILYLLEDILIDVDSSDEMREELLFHLPHVLSKLQLEGLHELLVLLGELVSVLFYGLNQEILDLLVLTINAGDVDSRISIVGRVVALAVLLANGRHFCAVFVILECDDFMEAVLGFLLAHLD
jgi:hypothetical protein